MQALPAAESRLLHSDRHLLGGLLPLLLQAAVEPDRGQHIQPGVWAAQVLGHSNPAGQCSAAAGVCGVAGPEVSMAVRLPRKFRRAMPGCLVEVEARAVSSWRLQSGCSEVTLRFTQLSS